MTPLGDSTSNYSVPMFPNNANTFETQPNYEQDTNTIFSGYKRPAEMRDGDGAPRAKRRFDRMSARLENFRIDRDEECPIQGSSDEDMDDTTSGEENAAVVEEPDDEPSNWKKIKLDERLQQYLQRAREGRRDLWPKLKQTRGDELVLYQPTNFNPFDDPTMRGRITELSLTEAEAARILFSGPAPTISYPEEESDGDSQNGDSIIESIRSSSRGSSLENNPSPPIITELCADQLSPISSLESSSEDMEMEFD